LTVIITQNIQILVKRTAFILKQTVRTASTAVCRPKHSFACLMQAADRRRQQITQQLCLTFHCVVSKSGKEMRCVETKQLAHTDSKSAVIHNTDVTIMHTRRGVGWGDTLGNVAEML
jgi:hypothetical protein